jgi:protein-S-isoprenylcysteine O-methyltransferase Ste14
MLLLKRIGGILFNTCFFALLLFPAAGTLRWPRAWIFLGVNVIAATVSVFSAPENLIDERYKPAIQKGQPVTDRIVLIAFILSFCGDVVFIPLDFFHLHLLPPPGAVVGAIGLILFAAAWWLLTSALLANSFAAVVVRLQSERGQRVVDTGPYRYVRHPMYAGFIPLSVGMALWLRSYAAAIAAIVPIAIIAVRALFEEQFLVRNLPGYEEYRKRVRYRFIPYVW